MLAMLPCCQIDVAKCCRKAPMLAVPDTAAEILGIVGSWWSFTCELDIAGT